MGCQHRRMRIPFRIIDDERWALRRPLDIEQRDLSDFDAIFAPRVKTSFNTENNRRLDERLYADQDAMRADQQILCKISSDRGTISPCTPSTDKGQP